MKGSRGIYIYIYIYIYALKLKEFCNLDMRLIPSRMNQLTTKKQVLLDVNI